METGNGFPKEIEVIVTNIRMPFWSMVGFMVKWAVATIPAVLILTVIGIGIMGLLRGIFGSMMM